MSRIDCSLAPWHTPAILTPVEGETQGLKVGSQFGSRLSTITTVWLLEFRNISARKCILIFPLSKQCTNHLTVSGDLEPRGQGN